MTFYSELVSIIMQHCFELQHFERQIFNLLLSVLLYVDLTKYILQFIRTCFMSHRGCFPA